MKNLVYGILLCFILSCNSSKPKIGYLNWDGTNEFASNILLSFKEKAGQYGVEVLDRDARNNEIEQYRQAIELIDAGVKVLVIKPVNSVTAAAIVREAHKKGVIVIANDQLIRNCELDYYVTFDSQKVGEYMAREALIQKPKGTYVLLYGDKSDDNADLVKSGVLKVLQPHINNGNINLLYHNYIESWSLENAEHEIDMVLRLSSEKKIDAIIASCDEMARGAINVLKKFNMLNNVFIAGQNADFLSLKMIINNEQTITIAKSPKTLGFALADLAEKIATKSDKKLNFEVNVAIFNGIKEVPSVFFDPVVINKDNLEKEILSDGIISRNELFN